MIPVPKDVQTTTGYFEGHLDFGTIPERSLMQNSDAVVTANHKYAIKCLFVHTLQCFAFCFLNVGSFWVAAAVG